MSQEFYNTTDLKGAALTNEVSAAITQRNKIMDLFNGSPESELTPFEVLELAKLNCINSVRRAMTNLTTDGFLFKTDTKKIGDFGKKNYCWRLKI